MSFVPTLPLSGLAGWRLLNRTYDRQTTNYNNSPEIQRDLAYFKDKIGSITSAADLVSDRRLLKVALGAFGLEEDLNKGFFIRKVLEDGTIDPQAMANKLVDKRYKALSDAFGFGSPFGPRNGRAAFPSEITGAYLERAFEVAVGDVDQNMRLALGFRREMKDIAANPGQGDTGWYKILGSAPMRKVVETAFGLPSTFSSLDLDKQVATLKTRAVQVLGSNNVAEISASEQVDALIDRFLIRAQTGDRATDYSSAAGALTLLQNGARPLNGSGTLEAIFSKLY